MNSGNVLHRDINGQITAILNSARVRGVWQFELEKTLNFSKSHISESLRKLEDQGRIVRRREGGKVIRVWLTRYYPYPIKNVMRIWMLRAYEYLPMLHSVFSVFERAGYRIKIYPGNSGEEISTALSSGYADLAFLPTVTSIILSYSSNDIVILSGIASGCSGILKNSFSANEAVATTNASSMYALTNLRFSQKDVSIRAFNRVLPVMKEFLSGKLKYIALWEPYFSRCLSETGIEIDSTYSDLMDTIPCCAACTNSTFLKSAGSLIDSLLSEYAGMNMKSLTYILNSSLFRRICKMVFDEKLLKAIPFDQSAMKCFPFNGDLRKSIELLIDRLGIPIDPHIASRHIYR